MSKNGALTSDAILAKDDREHERVEVPEWGGHVYVWTLSMTELEKYQQEIATAEEKLGRRPTNMMPALVARTVCDSDGKRLFDDKQIAELGKKSAPAVLRLFNASVRLNRMTKEDIEELAGNSEGGPIAN